MRHRLFTDYILTFGAGQHLFNGLTRIKLWNLIAWSLIGVATIGWIAFLLWKP